MSISVDSQSDGGGQCRLTQDGYGLEVQGYDHRLSGEGEGMVFLPPDTRYRLRFTNKNDYSCMVTVDLDRITIGKLPGHNNSKENQETTNYCLKFNYHSGMA